MAACIQEASRARWLNGIGAEFDTNRCACWTAEWAAWGRVRAQAYADLAALLPDPAAPGETQAHEAARALAQADAAWAGSKGGDCGSLASRWLGTLRTEEGFTCVVGTEAQRAITYRLWRPQAEISDGFVGGG
jgi:hypothetical protein